MSSAPSSQILFEHVGIATALARNRLRVPSNQREYSWEDRHVKDLFQDVLKAMNARKNSYFLGTIVLTIGDNGEKEVADGQQRLATTTILLCAIRDFYYSRNMPILVRAIEEKFLSEIDRKTQAPIPHLQLNVEDNEFFRNRVLSSPGSLNKPAEPSRSSHHKIAIAQALAKEFIHDILKPYNPTRHHDILEELTSFLETGAQVILLSVPDDQNAFVMFETLNDRGLKTSQADLIKNHLFSEAENRLNEAQQKWAEMTGALESLGLDDATVTYLRHLIISKHGHVRERDLFETIREVGGGSTKAISLLDDIAHSAHDYVALLTPDHQRWNEYHESVRKSVRTLNQIRVSVIRPLMLSILSQFSPEEVAKAFKLLISWSVRIIVGGSRSGTIEEAYATLAKEVRAQQIKSAKELSQKATFVPSDAEFANAFGSATVSQSYLARYYLRSLELTRKKQPEPELIPNEERVITLEHVLPREQEGNWPHIEPELAAALYKRIGNMCLLPATVNSNLRSADFATKKSEYMESGFILTSEIANSETWGTEQIVKRQADLAALAVQTWPISIK